MVFKLFPDPPVAPLGVPGGGRTDAGFVQLAGEPLAEFAGIYARMMFLRVAMIGGTAAPSLFVRAGQGPAVAAATGTLPVFRATRPDGTGSSYVGDVFALPREGNVFRVLVGFAAATEETWSLGIRNNDPGAERYFTWAVADSDAEAAQPWVDPASFVPAFADPPAAPFAPGLGAPGTSVNLFGRNFNVGTPRVFFGAVEASLLAPPAAGALKVAVPGGLVVPGEPGADVPVSVQTAAGITTAATAFHIPMPEIVLIGYPNHVLLGVAETLRQGGKRAIKIGSAAVSDSTSLLLSVIDCRDGPMPPLADALRALDGAIIARAAVLIINTNLQEDPELIELVVLEALELHEHFGLGPMGSGGVIQVIRPTA